MASNLYEIRESPGKGLGAFATKDISQGTRILSERPLFSIDQTHYLTSDLEDAFAKLSPSDKEKYFSLASNHGQDPKLYPSQIHPDIPEKEKQRIQEQHDARTSKEKSLLSIFQTNCMEKESGAAVFSEAARFNHSCVPNACFAWNENIGMETIHATKGIKEGEEITLCYCDPLHEVSMRRWELQHYGFVCDCPACGDTSESESFAAESVERRWRLAELEDRMLGPLVTGSDDMDCRRLEERLEAAALMMEEGLVTRNLAQVYLDIATLCEARKDHAFAFLAAQKGLEINNICVGADSPAVEATAKTVRELEKKLQSSKQAA